MGRKVRDFKYRLMAMSYLIKNMKMMELFIGACCKVESSIQKTYPFPSSKKWEQRFRFYDVVWKFHVDAISY